jgi:hypothetical protein
MFCGVVTVGPSAVRGLNELAKFSENATTVNRFESLMPVHAGMAKMPLPKLSPLDTKPTGTWELSMGTAAGGLVLIVAVTCGRYAGGTAVAFARIFVIR